MIFFFSSRRRHTRCSRDWSSDVCSSDLLPAGKATPAPPVGTALGPHGLNIMDFCKQRSEEHTSELQSRLHLVCRLLLEKKKNNTYTVQHTNHTTNSTTHDLTNVVQRTHT